MRAAGGGPGRRLRPGPHPRLPVRRRRHLRRRRRRGAVRRRQRPARRPAAAGPAALRTRPARVSESAMRYSLTACLGFGLGEPPAVQCGPPCLTDGAPSRRSCAGADSGPTRRAPLSTDSDRIVTSPVGAAAPCAAAAPGTERTDCPARGRPARRSRHRDGHVCIEGGRMTRTRRA
jgi:hypothetical protein